MFKTRAKVVRVGNNWQVLVKDYGKRPRRMCDLYGHMKWNCTYNSKQSVEETVQRIWNVEIVQQFD